MKSVKVYLYVSARPEPNDPQYVCVSHMKIRWGRHCQNTHLPNGSAGCIEIRPDLDCFSVQDNRSARRWMNKHEQARVTEGERETQLAVVGQHEQRTNVDCVRRMNMTFAGGCPRTMDTGHRTVQRRVRRIERNGEQERRGRVTGIQQATKKGSKNLLTHTHNTLTYTDSNNALCNEDMLANLYVWVCGRFE